MAKLALFHEGIDNKLTTKKRKVLKNTYYIGSSILLPNDFWHLVYDYVNFVVLKLLNYNLKLKLNY